jgi:hypothetical protein
MHLYYTTLPLIEDENMLLIMANTFATHLWGDSEQYAMEYLDYAIQDRYEPVPYTALPGQIHNTTGTINIQKLNSIDSAKI